MNPFAFFQKSVSVRKTRSPRIQLRLEALEAREVPYAVSGNAWMHPELVTLSFQPDGTNLGGVTSNLVSTFNSRFGTAATWQRVLARSAQVWAQQTNVNFAVITDNGAPSGSGLYQQGDPGFGDIRIGGYNTAATWLGLAFLPPPINNYSLAGDFAFNSSKPFNINGQDFDLFSVGMHEFGHVLGLDHSDYAASVMYPTYTGALPSLAQDDINGIRAIYGAPRANDSYDVAASNGSFATASVITSSINQGTLTGLVTNLDITTIADVDYYKFTAPASGAMTLKVQSSGLSLLTPQVRVYNSSQAQIGAAFGSSTAYTGATLTVTANVTAGQQYYVMVDGLNTTAFGTGKYALTLNFGAGSNPVVPLPNTMTLNGNPLSGSGGIAENDGDEGGQDPDPKVSYCEAPAVQPGATGWGGDSSDDESDGGHGWGGRSGHRGDDPLAPDRVDGAWSAGEDLDSWLDYSRWEAN